MPDFVLKNGQTVFVEDKDVDLFLSKYKDQIVSDEELLDPTTFQADAAAGADVVSQPTQAPGTELVSEDISLDLQDPYSNFYLTVEDIEGDESDVKDNIDRKLAQLGISSTEGTSTDSLNAIILQSSDYSGKTKEEEIEEANIFGGLIPSRNAINVGEKLSKQEKINSVNRINEFIRSRGDLDFSKKAKFRSSKIYDDYIQKITAPDKTNKEIESDLKQELLPKFKEVKAQETLYKEEVTIDKFKNQEEFNLYKDWMKNDFIGDISEDYLKVYDQERKDKYSRDESLRYINKLSPKERLDVFALVGDDVSKIKDFNNQLNKYNNTVSDFEISLNEFQQSPTEQNRITALELQDNYLKEQSNIQDLQSRMKNSGIIDRTKYIPLAIEDFNKDYNRVRQLASSFKSLGTDILYTMSQLTLMRDPALGSVYASSPAILNKTIEETTGLISLGEEMRKEGESFQRAIAVDEINSLSDASIWAAGASVNLIPSLAMAATGPLAMPLFALSGAGGKGMDIAIQQKNAGERLIKNLKLRDSGKLDDFSLTVIEDELEQDKKKLGLDAAKVYGTQALYAAAELAFERLGTIRLLNNVKKGIKELPPVTVKESFEFIGKNLSKGMALEGGTEFLTTFTQNFGDVFILGEDKSLFEGALEAFAQGAFMGGAMKGAYVANGLRQGLISVAKNNRETRELEDNLNSLRQITGLKDITSWLDLKNPELKLDLNKETQEVVDNIINKMQGTEQGILFRLGGELNVEQAKELEDVNRQMRMVNKRLVQASTNPNIKAAQLKVIRDELKKQFDDLVKTREGILSDGETIAKNKEKAISNEVSLENTSGWALYNQRMLNESLLSVQANFENMSSSAKQLEFDNASSQLKSEGIKPTPSQIKERAIENFVDKTYLNRIKKGQANAQQFAKDLGLDIEVIVFEGDTANELTIEAFENEGFSGKDLNNLKKSVTDGSFEGASIDGTNKIIINLNNAVKNKRVGIFAHEVLHKYALIKYGDNKQAIDTAGKDLLSYLEKNDKDLYTKVKFRIDQSYAEKGKDGELELEKDYYEEAMNAMSDVLADGQRVNESTISKMRLFANSFLNSLPNKFQFKLNQKEEVYQFIKNFNKAAHFGGKNILDPIKPKVEKPEEEVKKEPTTKLSKSAEASQEVQKIYDEQGVAGAFEIIEKFKPITSKLVERRSEAPNFDRQLLTDEIETGKRGILDLISEYKPESGVPLAAYINKFLPARAIEASKRVLGEEFTADVTEARGVAAAEVTDDVTVEKEVRGVRKPTETTRFSETALSELGVETKAQAEKQISDATKEAFKDQEITRFGETRNIPQSVADIYGKMFGVNPQTIVDKRRNYQKTDAEGLTRIKQYLIDNAPSDFARLPKTKDAFGKGTFIPKNVTDALYTDGKLTGTLKDYLDLIRQKPVKPIYRDRVGQTIRGLFNTSIRNRMLEDLIPEPAKRAQAGAKFSKTKLTNNYVNDLASDLNKNTIKFSKTLYELNELKPGTLNDFIDGIKSKEFASILKASTRLDEAIKIYFKDKINPIKLRAIAKEINNSKRSKNFYYQLENISKDKAVVSLTDNIIEELMTPTEYRDIFAKYGVSSDYNLRNIDSVNQGRIAASWLKNKLGDKKFIRGFYRALSGPARLAGFEIKGDIKSIVLTAKNILEKVKRPRNSLFNNTRDINYNLDIKSIKNLFRNTEQTRKNWWFSNKFNKLSDQGKKDYLNKLYEDGQIDKDILLESIDLLREGYKDKDISLTGVQMLLVGQFADMTGVGKAAAAPRFIPVNPDGSIATNEDLVRLGLAYKKDPYVLEHMIPAKRIATLSFQYIITGNKSIRDQLLKELDNYDTSILPKKLDDVLKKERGTQEAMGIDYKPGMSPIETRYKDLGIQFYDAKTGKIVGSNVVNEYKKLVPGKIKASKSNNNKLPKSQQLKGDFNNSQVLQKMGELDEKANEERIKFSKSINLDKQFNDILEAKTGIASEKRYGKAKAQVAGASRGKAIKFIPYSAQDFVGLLYETLSKGKLGDAQMAWYQENLIRPFARAMNDLSSARLAMMNDYRALKKELKIVPKNLRKKIKGEPWTKEQAVRVYIWNKQGLDIPGISKADLKDLTEYVANNAELQVFADQLIAIQKGDAYPAPKESWVSGSISTDLLQGLNTVKRAKYLEQWQRNVDEIFSQENKNKLQAAYGEKYVKALENSLQRMKTGRNRLFSDDSLTGRFTDWLQGSVGAIMFFNTRSALLQTISAVNFINFTDNNPIAAAKAFGNQKQYWNDFVFLLNSDFLKERRAGLRMNVSESDIADMAKQEGPRGVINKLLQLGFAPTQIADSFAIASGGATFYRNRVKTYLKDGLDQKAAEQKAFEDFRENAEESQQSSRPDRISMQQAGPLGRLILAFANTPAQYARLTDKAIRDLRNGRGDAKTNISKIVYYMAVQNLIFNAVQQALFAMAFGDEEEEDEKKQEKYLGIVNGMADSILRGTGFAGAAISVGKNSILRIMKEAEKKRPKFEKVGYELTKISPPISAKLSRINQAARAYQWNKEEMKTKGFSLDNPAYLAGGNVVSALTNVPLDRVVKKVNNVVKATDSDLELWERLALFSGWQDWEIGLKEETKTNKPQPRKTKSKGIKRRKVKLR